MLPPNVGVIINLDGVFTVVTSSPLSKVLRETLVLFDDSGAPQTTTEVAERLDLGRRSTYERLTRLVDHDQIETKKVGANGRVWWRSTTTNTAGQSASAQDRSATGESDIDDTPVRKQFERGGRTTVGRSNCWSMRSKSTRYFPYSRRARSNLESRC